MFSIHNKKCEIITILSPGTPCGFWGLEQTHSISWPDVVKGD